IKIKQQITKQQEKHIPNNTLIPTSVNAADGNIEKISMDERDGRISVVQLVVSVHDRVHLARVIKKLRALTGVIRITRMRA
ncbi:ACT domain-containing protein, partial [Pseudomonas moraviensis]|uniref:ACT domain-containing protein n=1 Tax=Pseudomonas moraviensis TaxID=321662 RepID=UPI00380DD0E7